MNKQFKTNPDFNFAENLEDETANSNKEGPSRSNSKTDLPTRPSIVVRPSSHSMLNSTAKKIGRSTSFGRLNRPKAPSVTEINTVGPNSVVHGIMNISFNMTENEMQEHADEYPKSLAAQTTNAKLINNGHLDSNTNLPPTRKNSVTFGGQTTKIIDEKQTRPQTASSRLSKRKSLDSANQQITNYNSRHSQHNNKHDAEDKKEIRKTVGSLDRRSKSGKKPTLQNIDRSKIAINYPNIPIEAAKQPTQTIKALKDNPNKTRLDQYIDNPKMMTPNFQKGFKSNLKQRPSLLKMKLTKRNSVILANGKVGISNSLFDQIKKRQPLGHGATDTKLLQILDRNNITIAGDDELNDGKSLKRRTSKLQNLHRGSFIGTHEAYNKTNVLFSLTNDKFFSDGWVSKKKGDFLDESKNPNKKQSNEIALEETTVIKWAANRVIQALKKYEYEKLTSPYSYLFLPLKISFYTDRKDLELLAVDFVKPQKDTGMLTGPKISSIDYSDNPDNQSNNQHQSKSNQNQNQSLNEIMHEVFYLQHPDKSIIVYYPNGNVAVMQSCLRNGSCNTLVFSETGQLTATFGKSYQYYDLEAYSNNFKLKDLGLQYYGQIDIESPFLSERKTIFTYNTNKGYIYPFCNPYNQVREFQWPEYKNLNIKQRINIKINNFVTLVGGNLENLTLIFNTSQDTSSKTLKLYVSSAGDLIRSHRPKLVAKNENDIKKPKIESQNIEFTSNIANFLKNSGQQNSDKKHGHGMHKHGLHHQHGHSHQKSHQKSVNNAYNQRGHMSHMNSNLTTHQKSNGRAASANLSRKPSVDLSCLPISELSKLPQDYINNHISNSQQHFSDPEDSYHNNHDPRFVEKSKPLKKQIPSCFEFECCYCMVDRIKQFKNSV
jgi:hypothetical protein